MRLRTWPAVAAAAAALLAAQPAVAQAMVKFYADSGDSCRRGVTEGTLDWVEGPVIRPTVRVSGYLADEGVNSPCAQDGMLSRATFSAYNGTTLVDSEAYKADDQRIVLSFALSDPSGVTAINRVVVQVCRFSVTPIGISYCGRAAQYKAP
ncbi:hypothetical protein ETD86_35550 [Nonomuraea turkmeniaca]|uniref:Uncharacterized protein n=1 Tax=Nonomuraea turkmeniaca TaxID=103838 RepID=A0A5S4F5G5_9ACTN|nr:hypothetical protein [Nonomuraea turkmeniaca]TMR11505.1 hypothetical protein ETD86_35550 [Nonomuraea turkmeniaca]